MSRISSQLDFLGDLFRQLVGGAKTEQPIRKNPTRKTLIIPTQPQEKQEVAEELPGLEIAFSARMKKGWRFEYRKWLGTGSLVMPAWMEAPAAAPIRGMVVRWAQSSFGRQTEQKRAARKALEKQIWSESAKYFEERGEEDPTGQQRQVVLRPQGRTHDLGESFARVNAAYFESQLECRVTWSARNGGLSFHSRRKAKDGSEYHLISISRGYDMPNCPQWAVDGVMYHECLHAHMGVEEREGRRRVHPPEFKRRERLYAHYHAWIEWHRTVLPRNVYALRRNRSKL